MAQSTDAESHYAAYYKQERGMAEAQKLRRWMALPEETREEFRQISERRANRRALRRYTLGVLGVAAAVVVGAACLAVDAFILGRHQMTVLGIAGLLLLVFGWIPSAEMASSAKRELERD